MVKVNVSGDDGLGRKESRDDVPLLGDGWEWNNNPVIVNIHTSELDNSATVSADGKSTARTDARWSVLQGDSIMQLL